MISPLVLPWPPSSNTYYRSVMMGKACRVILSKRGREFRQEVIELVEARVADDEELRAYLPLVERLGVGIMLDPPTRRAFDVDNRAKAILDALEHAGVYEDDGQIDSLTLTRGEIVKGGRAIINFRSLPSREQGATHALQRSDEHG